MFLSHESNTYIVVPVNIQMVNLQTQMIIIHAEQDLLNIILCSQTFSMEE